MAVKRLQESRRQLDNGEFTEYDDDSLTARFDGLKAMASGQSRD
ncbi:hypothetical protein [Rhodopirellula baltica]|uniref:Uncharacterized protein n=1 Tax=Rhodopirellula baltica WH47 TaxID=991778 RepID=F2ANK5_RHOBT|nr:hypothetical protein [Rhodopirellula baltica]EGF28751.1 hypothetical protein RBWH47_03783 [Rhodopirellula baltica WH47]